MCTVSNVVDFGRQMPSEAWDRNLYFEFQLLLRRMSKIDQQLGLKNCEDPAKKEWMKAVEERLANLENPKPKNKPKRKKNANKKS